VVWGENSLMLHGMGPSVPPAALGVSPAGGLCSWVITHAGWTASQIMCRPAGALDSFLPLTHPSGFACARLQRWANLLTGLRPSGVSKIRRLQIPEIIPFASSVLLDFQGLCGENSLMWHG
jgi:hypothetical protein